VVLCGGETAFPHIPANSSIRNAISFAATEEALQPVNGAAGNILAVGAYALSWSILFLR